MNQKGINAAAVAVRTLTMDAVQKANSGHPGMPLGCAELGSLIFGEILSHNPADPDWVNRDRFVLSAGHGSMLLYALLHLSGYDLSLEELKNFRQLGSRTPGHPEYGITPGVETTTGPLGQGISNAVGLAMAERMLAARFNTEKHAVVDHRTYVLAGDGDLMEGVSSEACSLAGHLGLGKLIVFYDSNRITIEGSTNLAFSEDVLARFGAYNWQTLRADAYDLQGILACAEEAAQESERPTLILLNSEIARGAATMAGSHKTHGAPLGEEEVRRTKEAMGVPGDSSFYIPEEAKEYFADRRKRWAENQEGWQKLFAEWGKENPALLSEWERFFAPPRLAPGAPLVKYETGASLATRKAGGEVLNALAARLPNLVGGSADLGPSNATEIKAGGSFQKDAPAGRNLHFGVREHGMGAILNGLALHGGLKVFGATFLVFSDYMRPAIRLAALMKLPVVYVFTHDSVFVGEDGPTHQPIEQLAALRVIPNLWVLRPGDAEETEAAWRLAAERTDGPVALVLSRQNLPVYAKQDEAWRRNIARGAYLAADSQSVPETVLLATGSEVSLALEVRELLGADKVRVVSVLSRELFMAAGEDYRAGLLPPGVRRVALEAGVAFGWHELCGPDGLIVSIDRFGESGPPLQVAAALNLSAEAVAARVRGNG
jgi:transketolase